MNSNHSPFTMRPHLSGGALKTRDKREVGDGQGASKFGEFKTSLQSVNRYRLTCALGHVPFFFWGGLTTYSSLSNVKTCTDLWVWFCHERLKSIKHFETVGHL